MAWSAPTRHLKRKELLDAKRFYRLLSKNCNFVDDDTVFLWYIGLVTLIGDELRKNKFIRLPLLADIALVTQKPRPAWIGKSHLLIGSREVLKVYPKEKLRRYFASKQGAPRYSEVLPPPPIT